jgi:hypothetical protein
MVAGAGIGYQGSGERLYIVGAQNFVPLPIITEVYYAFQINRIGQDGTNRQYLWPGAQGCFKDLLDLLKFMFKASILGFILNPKQWFNKKPQHPGEF